MRSFTNPIISNHKAVTAQHVYKAFQDAMLAKGFIDFQFVDAFEPWQLQRGFPVIHVTHSRPEKRFRITQKRYLTADSDEIDASSWFVPLNFAHANNPNFDEMEFTHFFESETSEKLISTDGIQSFDDDEWFVFNKQQLGYYRVNYDVENWWNIIRTLNSENYQQIHVLNRAQLVDDAFNFAIDGLIDFDIALGLLSYLQREVDYLPWASAVSSLERLDVLLHGDEVRAKLHYFVNYLVSRMYATHGLERKSVDEFSTNYVRELAINWSCRTGNEKCLRSAHAKVKLAMNENKSMAKPLEIAFLCNGLKGDDKTAEFAYFWKKMLTSVDQAERLRLIDGLACATNPESIKSFLDSSLEFNNDFNYRLHERTKIFNSIVSSSSVGIFTALDFVSKNFLNIQYL